MGLHYGPCWRKNEETERDGLMSLKKHVLYLQKVVLKVQFIANFNQIQDWVEEQAHAQGWAYVLLACGC